MRNHCPAWRRKLFTGFCFGAALLVAVLLGYLSASAEPQSFSRVERVYYDWPSVLAVGESHAMKGYRVYYSGSRLLEREDVTDRLVYVSTDERVIRVLPGNVLEAVGSGVCSLKVEETDRRTVWTTTKTIAVAANVWQVETANRTPAEIAATYKKYRPTFQFSSAAEKFAVVPQTSAPYEPGQLTPAFVRDGLAMTNFVRYLAGLPADLQLDSQLNKQAQVGALVLGAVDDLTHTPGKPRKMKRDLYDVGYTSTTSSNLSSGVETLSEQVLGFMDDLGMHNLQNVGHRRWILNPPLKKTGFGFAYAAGSTTPYGVMQVFDTTDETEFKVNYDFIAWPPAGPVPETVFAENAPWSLTPNPAQYDLAQAKAIRVELTDESRGTRWILDKNDRKIADEGEFFHLSMSEAGYPSAIVFRPRGAQYEAGSLFHVRVSGLPHRERGTETVEYRVQFFALDGWVEADGWSRVREITVPADGAPDPGGLPGYPDPGGAPGDGQPTERSEVPETVPSASELIAQVRDSGSTLQSFIASLGVPVWMLWAGCLAGMILCLLLLLVRLRKRK